MSEAITLGRACEVVEIPSGDRHVIAVGTVVRITQSLGGSYTVATEQGNLYRIGSTDADALGLAVKQSNSGALAGATIEQTVWNELRTVFDPEIPVNIADLGLIYSCEVKPLPDDSRRVEIKMTLTAPGCGMSDVIKADVERRLLRLPTVKEVKVEVVFDPPWNPGLMSEAAKLQLGFDLDFGSNQSALPIFKAGR
jgi:probable FeS assembly SUF system protein SufT